MGEVIEINQKRVFTSDDAKELLSLVRRITEGAHAKIQKLNTQLNFTKDRAKKVSLEESIRSYFQEWHDKVRKLGCDPKGMWLVDFDNGDGFYCWHYPEPNIEYFHGYLDGFRGRVRIH